jgi:class 3 adenylate cyclase
MSEEFAGKGGLSQELGLSDRPSKVLRSTFFFADFKGYTERVQILEQTAGPQAAVELRYKVAQYIEETFHRLKTEIKPSDYQLIDTAGDGFFFHFREAKHAFLVAEGLQKLTSAHNAEVTDDIAKHLFRTGAATGDAAWERGKPVGHVVNVGSRLQSASTGGDLVVDQATFDALPHEMRQQFGQKEIIRDKHDKAYEVYRTAFGRTLSPLPTSNLRSSAWRSGLLAWPRLTVALAVGILLLGGGALLLMFLGPWGNRDRDGQDTPGKTGKEEAPTTKTFEEVLAELESLNPGFTGKHARLRPEGSDVVLELTNEESLKKIAPLRDLHPPVTHLLIDRTGVEDLRPLKEMTSLRHLNCNKTPVNDLSPLKDLQLTSLELNETMVETLEPLRNMQLTSLDCYRTEVNDLSPLQGMPLETLNCAKTRVKNLTYLQRMPLVCLECDPALARALQAEFLRKMKTLRTINDMPAAQFWQQGEP